MKHKLTFFAIVMMALAIPQSVKAYDFSYTYQGQTLYYNIVDGNAQVTYQRTLSPRYTNLSGNLVIPDSVTYNGNTYAVTTIGERAFDYCSGLTSVTIPDGVTSIGNLAFSYCSGLTSVAFNADSCTSAGTSYNNTAFYGCTNIANFTFGDNVKVIPNYLCYGLSGLTSVTIPDAVTSIGNYAFYYCTGLTSVTIPDAVTSISNYSFYGCSGLTSITIPDAVTSIGGGAFSGCSGLTSIVVSSGNVTYDSRNNCNAIIETATNTLIAGCKNTIIPTSVASIGGSAFYGCSDLSSVIIPDAVTSIGYYAFSGCSGLTSVTIPNAVTSIGNYAFRGCSGLTSVTIGNAVTSIGDWAFYGCSGLTSVAFNADSCTSAGYSYYNAFNNCTNITNFTFGNNVKVIPDDLCYGLSGLTSVTIPDAVTTIGSSAFYGCSGLTSVTIPDAVTAIGYSAFYGCTGLTSVTIPDAVTSISNYSFYGCSGLTSVTIGNGVTSIGDYAFAGCSGLTSVTIPDAVTSIGGYAFRYCSGLTSVSIGNGVTSIGEYAFRGCSGLTSVTIPDAVTSISDYSFSGCSGLTSVTIGNAVTSIGDYAFYGCSGLTSVTIPDAVTSIGDYAFHGCSGLTSVTIGNAVTSIGNYAFNGCSGLTSVIMLPEAAPVVGERCFNSNASTREFYIPCGSYDSYYNGSGWSEYRNHLLETNLFYTITLEVNDSARGNVANTPISCADQTIISATANYGYHFDHWSNGSTANPDTITLVGDSTVTAYFERNTYHLTANVNDATLGMVSFPQGDSALYLDTLMAVAQPAAHHHLVSWQCSDSSIVATSADRNTVWVKLAGDCNLTCNFVIDTHTVSVATNDIARGMVESTGTEFVYGTPCTVTATAYSGYTFAGWSNGVSHNPYTFAVMSDVELTALFVEEGEEVYTVTVVSADPTMGTVSGGGQSLDGGTVTIRAAGNPGYRFVRWNDNNIDSVRTVEVHGNVTYTAYFEALQGIDDVAAKDIRMYAGDGEIVLEGSEGMAVSVYDMMGRKVFSVMAAPEPCKVAVLQRGVYLVKVGNLPARKVVVVR